VRHTVKRSAKINIGYCHCVFALYYQCCRSRDVLFDTAIETSVTVFTKEPTCIINAAYRYLSCIHIILTFQTGVGKSPFNYHFPTLLMYKGRSKSSRPDLVLIRIKYKIKIVYTSHSTKAQNTTCAIWLLGCKYFVHFSVWTKCLSNGIVQC